MYDYRNEISIKFYRENDKYGEFSNFYPCPNLNIDGKNWKTVEHYF